jgi:ATP-dependent Clp protease ATP-binding subunit ClpC
MAHTATIQGETAELGLLYRKANELAHQLSESVSTRHLLAAVALSHGPTGGLLSERQLTAERILDARDKAVEPKASAPDRMLYRAVELARKIGISEANAAHLLVAILSDGNCAGRRALERLSIDSARLRSQAWNIGLGRLGRHAAHAVQRSANESASAPMVSRVRPATGITIPLFPAPEAGSSPRKTAKGKAQSLPIMPERPLPKTRGARTEPAEPKADVAEIGQDALRARSVAATNLGSAEASQTPGLTRVESKKRGRTFDRFELDPKRFPVLTHVGRNLTLEAAQNRLDEVAGRVHEMDQTLDVLAKWQGNSPCLVGPSGVGKTSIVRGLALRIARHETTSSLDQRILVEIPVSELIAGTGVRGALAQRLATLRQEVKQAAGKVVIFFDEIHLLFVGDAADESAGELKLALSRGEFPCIGATTAEDYRRAIDNDPALARRFSAIEVAEPTVADARRVLATSVKKLSLHHGVGYDDQALARAIDWSVRYLPARSLPEKAISIADLAGARARRRAKNRVEAEQVAEVVAEMADIPVERLLESDGERLLALERSIAERVVGHAAAVGRICSVLRRNAAGLGAGRPIGTFLLLGPTGVGKTETAKALAHALFHAETAMTRLDMAEYSESHAVAKLIGAPPGYIGHDAGGQLTEAVRKRPYQVVLLDEVEKAHTDVLQAFLGVFDEGRLTDSRGRTVDFRNTIILMTSNLGAEHTQMKAKRRVGFAGTEDADSSDQGALVIGAARAHLSPELYNRIDECLVFSALSREEVKEIARRLLNGLKKSLSGREIELRISDRIIEHLVEQGGFDRCLGARPMKRTIARLIEAPLAELLLSGRIRRGTTVSIEMDGDSVAFKNA